MRKKLLNFTAIAVILLFNACSNEELLPEAKPEAESTFSLTASMPDDPNTRVSLTQEGKNIKLKWEVNDQIQLAFVQGSSKTKGTAKVASISDDGKKAQFDLVLPVGIKPGEFDLYGVFGGGGLSEDDPTKVILTTNPSEATSLKDPNSSIQSRKDVMLYFASEKIKTDNPTASVNFKHLGSLFSITLINVSSNKSLANLAEARLVGVGGTEDWAYNAKAGGGIYNLLTNKFENQTSAGNYISFKTDKRILSMVDMITFWAWYPPLSEKEWPELKLELVDTNGQVLTTSVDSKPARNAGTTATAGKSYHFYATLDYVKESEWDFESNKINLKFSPTFEYTVSNMGGLSSVLGDKKENIVALILKGEINNADFVVMRDNLPNLRYLDLSAVTCQDNTIPEEAFYVYDPFGGDGFPMPGEEETGLKISRIILPPSITSIGVKAFSGCSKLTGDIKLPSGVISIGAEAYKNCSGLTGSLNLAKLTTLGAEAFSGCRGLNGSLTLPTGMTSIAKLAFFDCRKLTGPLEIPSGITSIGESAFTECHSFTGSLNLTGIITIGRGAFWSCKGLDGTLTLPPAMTSIEADVFGQCYNLTGPLNLPVGLTNIGNYAFYHCNSFTGTLILPTVLKTIGEHAFQNCESLTGTIIFPISLENIGMLGFDETWKVEAFQFPHSTTIPFPYSYKMLPMGKTVKVPQAVLSSYNVASWNARHAGKIVGY